MDDIENAIQKEQMRVYQELEALKELVKNTLELDDKEFGRKQKEVMKNIKPTISRATRSKKRVRRNSIIAVFRRNLNIRNVVDAIENEERMEQTATHGQLNLKKHIEDLLDNVKNYEKEDVINDAMHLLITLELIIKLSIGVQINLNKIQAKRLAMLDYFIHAFSRIEKLYGIVGEVNQLKQLKNRFKLLVRKDIIRDRNLKAFVTQLQKSYEEDVKRIENKYVLVYSAHENPLLAVQRVFILGNEIRDELNLDERFNVSRKDFLDKYKEVSKKVKNYNEKQIHDKLGWDHRRNIYKFHDWRIESIPIEDIGAWPSPGGINHFITRGNLARAVKLINLLLYAKGRQNENELLAEWSKEYPRSLMDKNHMVNEQKKLNKLRSIIRHIDFIYRLFPIIISKEGNRTFEIVTKHDEKTRDANYEKTRFDIDDGSHRALAYVMFGIKRIRCFVGRKKSPLGPNYWSSM